MDTAKPIDEYSFLMDDKEFEELTSELKRRHRKIEKHTDIIEQKKIGIDRKINEVCTILFTDIKAAREYQTQHGEIQIHEFREHCINLVGTSSIKISYEVEYGANATVYISYFDSYEGEEGSTIIMFPLNFIHRADWVAKLSILKEALVIKAARIEEDKKAKAEAAQKAKDLENLRTLLEKYKDEI